VFLYTFDYFILSSQRLKWIITVNQSCPKTSIGFVQNSCITLLKCFDPLQMLATITLQITL